MTDDGNGSVRVTLPQIYDELRSVSQKVDGLVNAVPDHESRIRFLEKAVWSAGALGTVVGGVIATLIARALGGHA